MEARNRGTVKQREKPDQGRRGDTVGEQSVTQPNPSLFDKHHVVDTNNAFWFTWSKGASSKAFQSKRIMMASSSSFFPKVLQRQDKGVYEYNLN